MLLEPGMAALRLHSRVLQRRRSSAGWTTKVRVMGSSLLGTAPAPVFLLPSLPSFHHHLPTPVHTLPYTLNILGKRKLDKEVVALMYNGISLSHEINVIRLVAAR